TMWFILTTFYAGMAGGALVIEFFFQALGWIPSQRSARVVEASLSWNYTTILNILFLLLAASLLYRFFKTGGPEMLRMMNHPAGDSGKKKDPVCGMMVDPTTAEHSVYRGETYYFCSRADKERFDREPEAFLNR